MNVFRKTRVEIVRWVAHGIGWWKVRVLAPTQWQMAAIVGPQKVKTLSPIKWAKMAEVTALTWELEKVA